MTEPTHAPGWRGRPRRIGPIAEMEEAASGLEAVCLAGCAAGAAISLFIAAFVYASCYLRGHL